MFCLTLIYWFSNVIELLFHRWKCNKEAGRLAIGSRYRSAQRRATRTADDRDWRAVPPRSPAERPPSAPPSAFYIYREHFPAPAVRHTERYPIGSGGSNSEPRARDEALRLRDQIWCSRVSHGRFQLPIDLFTITSRRSWSRLFSANTQYKRDLWYFSSFISSERERFNFFS